MMQNLAECTKTGHMVEQNGKHADAQAKDRSYEYSADIVIVTAARMVLSLTQCLRYGVNSGPFSVRTHSVFVAICSFQPLL